jgi:acetyl esterase
MLTEREKTVIREWNEFAAKMPPSLPEMRKALDAESAKMNVDPPEVGAIHQNVELRPGLRADVIVPKGAGPHPVMLYIHGGGWIMGSPKTHDKLARQFAAEGYLTLNLDYRLAPENPFPAGIDDCVFAAKWIASNAKRWNGDASRLAIGGDSAGGNLTAATLVALSSDASAPKARAGVLIYGVFDFPALLERTKNNTMLEGMTRAYLGSQYPAALTDPRVSPMRGVKAGALPPCFVICGTADELLAESKSMAEALRRANIESELHLMEEMPHAFMQMNELSACREGLKSMFAFLHRHA